MSERLMRSKFVKDIGVRVGVFEQLIVLDNLAETSDLRKKDHATRYYETARLAGFSHEEAVNLLKIATGGITYPVDYEDSRRRV